MTALKLNKPRSIRHKSHQSRRKFLLMSTAGIVISIAPYSLAQPATVKVTGSDIEGPFFRAAAPQRHFLGTGQEDERLQLSGKILGKNPDGTYSDIQNAKVNIWHASPNAIYDLHSSLNYHGYVMSDATGNYAFETCIPAAYTDGGLDRPAHIHFKVQADGFEPLTTQLYFSGDERLATDRFVRENNGLERAVKLQRVRRGLFITRFDIRLRAES